MRTRTREPKPRLERRSPDRRRFGTETGKSTLSLPLRSPSKAKSGTESTSSEDNWLPSPRRQKQWSTPVFISVIRRGWTQGSDTAGGRRTKRSPGNPPSEEKDLPRLGPTGSLPSLLRLRLRLLPREEPSSNRLASTPTISPVNNVFVVGNTANCVPVWHSITTSKWILNDVKGVFIPFITTPVQERVPHP
jgi:hypothetical protein